MDLFKRIGLVAACLWAASWISEVGGNPPYGEMEVAGLSLGVVIMWLLDDIRKELQKPKS